MLLFDEIEHGFDGVNLLQAGIDGVWSYDRQDPNDSSKCPQVRRSTAGSIIILTSNCYQDELRSVTQDVTSRSSPMGRASRSSGGVPSCAARRTSSASSRARSNLG